MSNTITWCDSLAEAQGVADALVLNNTTGQAWLIIFRWPPAHVGVTQNPTIARSYAKEPHVSVVPVTRAELTGDQP